ncbi:unnamed protein product [Medioppia subpectinata]|uniref:DNA replication complex GINS protein PSF3 n=1 Tax=Medioppia subpectinata TaxID=1979941 RepID=A0A7R9KPB0_9ACAR|nr:unnamed protein product [Medioppia subpectinata]CAG2106970.1 unnamed protein product [Medioppia subpectinata]
MSATTPADTPSQSSQASSSGVHNGSNRSQSSSSATNYCQNYFDINDILANSQRVVSTFVTRVPAVGPVLDPTGDTADVEVGSKLELPLWLARELHSEGLVDITVPKGFNRTYREILEADANCVDLHKLCPNYYRVGHHLSRMGLHESEDIAASLVETFHQRYHRIVNYSQSATSDTVHQIQQFVGQLDNEEKPLFAAGKQALDQMKEWDNRAIEKVTANEVVVNLRKRKHIINSDIITPNGSQSSGATASSAAN